MLDFLAFSENPGCKFVTQFGMLGLDFNTIDPSWYYQYDYAHEIGLQLRPTDIDKRNCILSNKNYLNLHESNFMRANTSFLKQFYLW